MADGTFEHWTDKEIRGLIVRLNKCQYGLLLRFKNAADLDYFKRKVYKLKVEFQKDYKVLCRTSPTDPKHELWLLKSIPKEGKDETREGAEEAHNQTV